MTTTRHPAAAAVAGSPLATELRQAEARRPPEEAVGARTRALFERHGRMVLGLCRVLLRDSFEAEDAAQQTFVNAHRALLAGARVRDDAAWLAAIARNECRARIVQRMRQPLALSYDDLVEVAGTAATEEPAELSDDLRRALAELPERQREAVVLRDVYGLRYREVGAALGLSRPAVESLLFRARRRLRVRLRPAAGVLVLPVALRESLAQALPGFAAAGGGSAAVGGAAGATGLMVKVGGGAARGQGRGGRGRPRRGSRVGCGRGERARRSAAPRAAGRDDGGAPRGRGPESCRRRCVGPIGRTRGRSRKQCVRRSTRGR